MYPRFLRTLLGVFLVTVPCLATAQTIINDGGTHTVNGPSGPIFVENGSTLNIQSPALISGRRCTSRCRLYSALRRCVFVDQHGGRRGDWNGIDR